MADSDFFKIKIAEGKAKSLGGLGRSHAMKSMLSGSLVLT